ncbi:MAG: PilZ domain-containing protein [PVC group bacterium]|nr:PilZ domain-containing protein [PVC group bacterium]
MNESNENIRLPISGEATYKMQGSFRPPISVPVNEISDTGLKFIATEVLAEGAILELSIKVTNVFDPMPAVGRVLWQRESSSKFLYDTAVKFVSIDLVKEKELLQYISQFARKMTISRTHIRCALNTEVMFKIMGDPETYSGMSVDVGILGLKMFTKDKVNINDSLNISFDLPNNEARFFVKGRVVWKEQAQNNVISIGIKFIEIEEKQKEEILSYIKSKLVFGQE